MQQTMPSPIETDAVIIGAGPVGLFQIFELGLLGIHAHVIDALPHAGGQCVELYADKPIYDIPALSVCSGRELVDRLLAQAAPFKADFHLQQTVDSVQIQADQRYKVQTSRGKVFLTKTLFVAAGVGAFLPRTLKVEGLEAFIGTQVEYQASHLGNAAGKSVVIVGGDDAALEAAIALCDGSAATQGPVAQRLTLVHRRDVFQAHPDTIAKFQALCALGAVQFIAGQVTGFDTDKHRLVSVEVTDTSDQLHSVNLDLLLPYLGLSPKLGPISQWGVAMERKQLQVNTATFETSAHAIFAVGDINTYPGKKKLIVCGFHEATLAAYGASDIIFPGQTTPLQYTTTSPALHKLLGVARGL
jgi:thioredoxin reductase (NADPH)